VSGLPEKRKKPLLRGGSFLNIGLRLRLGAYHRAKPALPTQKPLPSSQRYLALLDWMRLRGEPAVSSCLPDEGVRYWRLIGTPICRRSVSSIAEALT